MYFFMFFQLARVSEGFVASVTFVGPFAAMHSLVSRQV